MVAISPAQRRTRPKNPRAIALVEWPAKGKPRVVPVAILDNGHFHDASIYEANPVPMAIDYGVVYEVQQTGDPVGFATIDQVLTNNQGAFAAEATFQSKEDIAKARAPRQRETGMRPDPEEGPPKLRKGGPAAAKPEAKPDATAKAAPAETAPDDTEADGRPRLRKPAEAAAAPQEKEADTATTPREEGSHPRLRRGGEGNQAQGLPGGANLSIGGRAPTPSTMADNEPMRLVKPVRVLPAISDASTTESRSYVMPGAEKAPPKLRAGMEALAHDVLAKYAGNRPGGRPGALETVEVRAFDLALTNQATVVLTAQAHTAPATTTPVNQRARRPSRAAPAEGAATVPPDPELTYWVTVVARENYNGELRPLQSWATDSRHLDAYPRMELIDALDADGDGRGELLFRRISDQGRGYVIARAAPDQLVTLYDSSEPER